MRILVPSVTSTPAVGATALVCMMYSFFHTLVSVCVCVYDVKHVCGCVGVWVGVGVNERVREKEISK